MKILKRIKCFFEDYYAGYYAKKTTELYKGLDPDFLERVRAERKRVYEKFN